MSKWQSERSIHEMLKDTPPLRESSDSITSGTEAKFTTSKSMPFTSAYSPPDSGAASTSNLQNGNSKMETIKNWSLSTYKCTRQLLYEKLGKCSRTVDSELESEIASVRDIQRRYSTVLRLSETLTHHVVGSVTAQRAMADTFAELAQKSPDLQQQFLYNADTQRSLTRNGEILVSALQLFNNAMHTLVNKTIEDTLLTVKQYETARVEYDAYRSEAESGSAAARDAEVTARREKYERLKGDVAIKVQLLHQNRIKVMNKQLVFFHNTICAYFSGNSVALEAAVRHLNVRHNET